MKNERIPYIDSMKGFAILCVVFAHISSIYFYADAAPLNTPLFFSINNVISVFHMPLFFFISGFTFVRAYYKDGVWDKPRYWLRIKNLILTYFLYSTAFVLAKYICGDLISGENTLRPLLFMWRSPVALYWYLYVLVFLYLFLGRQKVFDLSARIMLPILFVCALIGSHFVISGWFYFDRILYYSFFFYLGIEFCRNPKLFLFNRYVMPVLLVCALVFAVIFWDASSVMTYIDYPAVRLPIALGIIPVILFLFKNARFLGSSRVLQYLGKHCFEIYLIHQPLITVCKIITQRLDIYRAVVVYAFNLLVCLGVPLLISLAARKLGLYDLCFRQYSFIISLFQKKKSV